MNYKLLKDLPELKAGNIFEFKKGSDNYCCQMSETVFYFMPKDMVENNPEWFQLIPEEEILQGFADEFGDQNVCANFRTKKGTTVIIPSILIRNPSEETKRKLGL
jgi:hypothetical protein